VREIGDQAQNESDAILAAIIRSSLDCIVVVDHDGRVVEFNAAAEATFGYARAEALGRPIAELIVPPHLRRAHGDGLARYLSGGEPRVLGRRVEVEAMRAGGETFPVELAITEVRVGERRLFTACLRDLSEKRAAAAALEASEARLAGFLDHAPAAMYLKDLDGRYVLANPFMLRALGRGADEVIGAHYADVVDPSTVPEIEATDRALLASGRPQLDEGGFRSPAGEGHVISVRFPVRDGAGAISHLGGVIIDVTERKRAEAQARESERRFSALTQFHPVPVTFVRVQDEQIVLANPAFYEMMRLPADAGDTLNRRSWYAGRQERDRIVALCRAKTRVDGVEAHMRRFDGSPFWAAISWRWIELDGEPVVVSSFVDLTDRKAAEAELARSREALHQSEKLTALGSLLAGVSHELNNPLAIVVGEAVVLEEDAEGTAFADGAARIKRAAERCARIVQNFLAMARQRPPERVAVDVNQLLGSALELAGYGLRTAGVRVATDLAPDLPRLSADPDQLHQVFLNLLINAQQAMQEVAGRRELAIRSYADGARVVFEFADTGPGVPPEIAPRIFEPFYTTKPQGAGTGVGLSYSQGIVEAHGGTLELLDGGIGATFRLGLPVGPPTDGHEDRTPAEPAGEASAGSVLIVDDEVDLAATLARLLERRGYAVEVAGGGAEGLARLARRDYDVILSDLRMPDVDGPAIFAWLSVERPHLVDRLAFVTGDTLGPAAVRFLADAGRPYVEKPFTRESIAKLLRELGAAPADAPAGR